MFRFTEVSLRKEENDRILACFTRPKEGPGRYRHYEPTEASILRLTKLVERLNGAGFGRIRPWWIKSAPHIVGWAYKVPQMPRAR